MPVLSDTLAVTTGKHKIGSELRVDGTSLIGGAAGALTPATSVVIWNITNGAKVKLGTAPVDTLGAWSLRLKPGPATQVSTVLIQSTRATPRPSTSARSNRLHYRPGPPHTTSAAGPDGDFDRGARVRGRAARQPRQVPRQGKFHAKASSTPKRTNSGSDRRPAESSSVAARHQPGP